MKNKKSTNKKIEYNKIKKNTEKSNYYEQESLQIEGRNSVLEALNKGRLIDKIFIKRGEIEGTLKVILAKAKENGIVVQEIDKIKIDKISITRNHQGVIAFCPAHKYYEVEDIIKKAKDKGEEPFIIILDEIIDPHNLGAIIRTAEVSGAHGIIIPKRRAVGLTGTVSKVSSGAIEHILVAKVTSITKEIERLKKIGIWVACSDLKGTTYFKADLRGPIAIVIGNEGDGVRRIVKEKCDYSVKIPMYGNINSLNASVAASLIMYEVVRQRKFLN